MRLQLMLNNSLSVIEYFHNTVTAIINSMLKGGMFGELAHYYGPIKYQGRGTPHTHLAVSPIIIFRVLTSAPVVVQRHDLARANETESEGRRHLPSAAVGL